MKYVFLFGVKDVKMPIIYRNPSNCNQVTTDPDNVVRRHLQIFCLGNSRCIQSQYPLSVDMGIFHGEFLI